MMSTCLTACILGVSHARWAARQLERFLAKSHSWTTASQGGIQRRWLGAKFQFFPGLACFCAPKPPTLPRFKHKGSIESKESSTLLGKSLRSYTQPGHRGPACSVYDCVSTNPCALLCSALQAPWQTAWQTDTLCQRHRVPILFLKTKHISDFFRVSHACAHL